jgi:hypothetical protein
LNAESTGPRKRPRLIRLILIDLLAASTPWLLSAALVWQVTDIDSWKMVFFGLVESPVQLAGILLRTPLHPAAELTCAVFLIHFASALLLHRRFYPWLRFLVPAHLFLVSAIPVGVAIWHFYRFSSPVPAV